MANTIIEQLKELNRRHQLVEKARDIAVREKIKQLRLKAKETSVR